MDPEAFLDLANQVTKLKMFPYFDIAHCLLCALSVREDLGAGNKKLNILVFVLFQL
jgi:trimeric intracellular cation channel